MERGLETSIKKKRTGGSSIKLGFGAFGRNVRSGRHRNSSGDLTWGGTEYGENSLSF